MAKEVPLKAVGVYSTLVLSNVIGSETGILMLMVMDISLVKSFMTYTLTSSSQVHFINIYIYLCFYHDQLLLLIISRDFIILLFYYYFIIILLLF